MTIIILIIIMITIFKIIMIIIKSLLLPTECIGSREFFPPVNRVFGQPVNLGSTAKTDLSPRRNKLEKPLSRVIY